MALIIVDTESTGTRDNQVCQFAYLTIYPDGKTEAGNFFFEVDDMSPYATDCHGLTMASLHRLSGGQRFADKLQTINGLLYGRRVAGHSVGCDLRALRQEFSRCGRKLPEVKPFCTMTHFTPIMNLRQEGQRRPKNPSLIEVCKYLSITDDEVLAASSTLYGASTNHHDARFDVCATHLCIARATQAGMLYGVLPETR